jgi:hypothetical protein
MPQKVVDGLMSKAETRFGGTFSYNAQGGYIDSVAAMLNPGEFVMSQSGTRNVGPTKLDTINSGGEIDQKDEQSGVLGKLDEMISVLHEAVIGNINIEITVDDSGNTKEDTKKSGSSQKTEDFAKKIKDIVVNTIQEEKRIGGLLR